MALDELHERTMPRRAIVALYEPAQSDWAGPFAVSLALDIVGSLVAVNGATLAVGCDSLEQAQTIATVLPFGVDLIVPSARTKESASIWLVKQHAERGFDLVLLVASDAIGVSARILSTAFSVLASDETVTGTTPTGAVYLVGLRTQIIQTASPELLALLEAVADGQEREPPGRQVSLRRRLYEFQSRLEFEHEVKLYRDLLPRTVSTLTNE